MAAQAQLKRPAVGFLWDHSVQGRAILPGAAMFEMTMAFGKVVQFSSAAIPQAQSSLDLILIPIMELRAKSNSRACKKHGTGLQVLHGMEATGNEVAVASGAMPTPFVLSPTGQPVATSRIHLASGTAEVRRRMAA